MGQTPMERNEADVTTAIAPQPAALTAGDRCDRCGAQAKTRVLLGDCGTPSGHGILLFCGHHTKKYTAALEEAGALIEGEM